MLRRLVAVALAAAVLVPIAASAQSDGCEAWNCEGSSTTVTPGSGGGDHNLPGNGGCCYVAGFAPAGPETQAALEYIGMPNTHCWQAVASAGGGTYYDAQLQAIANARPPDQPACPDLDAYDPAQLIRLWWEETVVPPTPTPTVEPDRGVTGIPVYLTIGGDRTPSLTLESPVDGQVFTIEAEARYYVYWDWTGDRADVTGPYRRNGVRYEDRTGRDEITHSYREGGERVIRVVARWTGTYNGQTFAQERVTQAEVALPIRQIQAVRRR